MPGTTLRRWILLGFAVIAIAVPSWALNRRDQVSFFASCNYNGRSWHDCTCTTKAWYNTPEEYRPVLREWASNGVLSQSMAVSYFVAGQTVQAARNEVGLDDLIKEKPKSWTIVAGLSYLRVVGPAVARRLSAPVAVVLFANDATSKLTEARAAIGRQCGGAVDGLIVSFEDTKVRVSDITTKAADSAGAGMTGAGKMAWGKATEFGNWLWSRH